MLSSGVLTICWSFLDKGRSDWFILHVLIGQSLEAGHNREIMTVAVGCHTSSSPVTATVCATLTLALRSIVVQ